MTTHREQHNIKTRPSNASARQNEAHKALPGTHRSHRPSHSHSNKRQTPKQWTPGRIPRTHHTTHTRASAPGNGRRTQHTHRTRSLNPVYATHYRQQQKRLQRGLRVTPNRLVSDAFHLACPHCTSPFVTFLPPRLECQKPQFLVHSFAHIPLS